MRIISMQKGGDVKGVFERLARGIKAVGDSVKAECGKDFALSEQYGFSTLAQPTLELVCVPPSTLTSLAGPRNLLTNLRLAVRNLLSSPMVPVENLVAKLAALMTSPTSIVLDTLRFNWSKS